MVSNPVKTPRGFFRTAGFVLLLSSALFAEHKWDGATAMPVHRLHLLDERGVTIYPDEKYPAPFSSRTTCGACHDYAKIKDGFHFRTAPSARPVQPWVLVDEKSGTQMPVSLRGGAGLWSLSDLGLSDFDFTRTFGRHMPGGGIGEPEDTSSTPRWTVSGKMEINCMACHNADKRQDMTEWAKQVARENFRWAATAASGIADVEGVAARMSDAWIPSDGLNRDDMVYKVPPTVKYHKPVFDTKGRAFLDVDKPTDRRCLQCHAVAVVGQEKERVQGDVHSAAGLSCVKCHRNGLDHDISRGLDGELSCEGCHIGVASVDGEVQPMGTYGAPYPDHKGLPPVHLEKLSCTTCHSGPLPDEAPVQVRTSRANRLGIHGIAQWYTEAPEIVSPVFIKGYDGKIAPHRMMWPAFWGKIDGEKVSPLAAEDVMGSVGDVIDPASVISVVLLKLGEVTDQSGDYFGTPVFVAGGKVYVQNLDGGLDVLDYKGAVPAEGLQFGYIVSNDVVNAIAAYDAKDTTAFYYLPEAEREHVMKVLEALAGLKDANVSRPVWVVDGKLHRIADHDFEVVSNEEAERMVKAVSDAKALVDDALKTLKIVIVKQGTSIQYYREGTQEKLYASKEPKLKDLREMITALTDAEEAYKRLERIGDKIYRATAVKNVVIEEIKSGPAKGVMLGWLEGGEVKSLVPDYAVKFVGDTIGGEKVVITEAQVELALKRLGDGHVYISNGKMFRLGSGGELVAEDNPAAEPVAWPVGHDVRPAVQSLGVLSCNDCHSANSHFFFGKVVAAGPLLTERGAVKLMNEFMGLDETFHRLFGLSFLVRPLFKLVLFACALAVIAVMVVYVLLWIKRLADELDLGLIERLTMLAAILSALVLVFTGFAMAVLIGRSLSGYALLIHTACGGLLAVCMVVLAVLRARDNDLTEADMVPGAVLVRKVSFWMMLVCGVVLILSVSTAMLPLFGTHGQHLAMLIHRYTAIGMVVLIALYMAAGRKM